MQVRLHTFHGPNRLVPFAAVCAEFDEPPDPAPGGGTAQDRALEQARRRLIARLLGEDGAASAGKPSFAEFAAALAARLQASHVQALHWKIQGAPGGRVRILLGFVDPEAGMLALCGALEIAEAVFGARAGATAAAARIPARLRQLRAALAPRIPEGYTALAMLRQARRLGIPVQPVAEGSRIWLYGHGARGVHVHGAASDRDALTGRLLAHDKAWANRLVTRLGFPGVVHAVVSNAAAAAEAAGRIGYPVVVKPVAAGKGEGVSAYVSDDAQLGAAFAQAARLSAKGVLIERRVEGIDHRLSVHGGTLAWVVARHPPTVTGDGVRCVEQLVDDENRRRRLAGAVEGGQGDLAQIAIDEESIATLARQGLSPASIPAAGSAVQLRTIANVSRGGTLSDCTARVHPDNRALAEAVARAFRMDTLGIDLITPDIGRSWREVPCAAIEVNQTPGVSYDAQAATVLALRFPRPTDARIPAVLLLDQPMALADRVAGTLQGRGLRVGLAGERIALLEARPRCAPGAALHECVAALLADPGCDAIVITATASAVEQAGLPLDRFDLVCLGAAAAPSVARLARAFSARAIDVEAPEAFDARVRPLLEALAGRKARQEPR